MFDASIKRKQYVEAVRGSPTEQGSVLCTRPPEILNRKRLVANQQVT